MERQKPWTTRAEREPLEKIARNVLDLLRKERLPIWKAKEVLKYAAEFLECEQLREKE